MGALGLGGGALGDLLEIDRLRHERLRPREEEEVVRDPAHLLRLLTDGAHVFGRAIRVGRAQRQVRVAVDRRRGVAKLVGRSRGDLPEVGQMLREGHACLEPADLGQIGEQRDGAQEAAVSALGRSRRDAEDTLLVRVAAPPHLQAPGDRAILEHLVDERLKFRRVGENRIVPLPSHLAIEPQDLAARLVELHDAAVGADREQAGREVARQRAGRRFEVVRAPLLGAREPLELPLLLVQRRDRALEAADEEGALVPLLAGRRHGASRRLEKTVVGLEQRAEVERGEHREREAGNRTNTVSARAYRCSAEPGPGSSAIA